MNSLRQTLIGNLGLVELNEMQLALLGESEGDSDVVLISPTGSGKTVAFLLLVIERAISHPGLALILAPTRELALQIEDVLKSMKTSHKVCCCYGGHDIGIEIDRMREQPGVLIGTPGRIGDHLRRRTFDPSSISTIVLDEFDKSLELGFQETMREIFADVPPGRRLVMTSATRLEMLPDFLRAVDPRILDFSPASAASRLETICMRCTTPEKVQPLLSLLAGFAEEASIVFCNHIEVVNNLSEILWKNGFAHGIFHGELEQIDREKNLIKFRGGAHNLLIATDLAARGLDVPAIRNVVHFELPFHQESYLHRNGRTARMHADGKAFVLLGSGEPKPEYIDDKLPEVPAPTKWSRPPEPVWECIYVSAGKKQKISKGDVVGFLVKSVGLESGSIGLITIHDHASFVCVRREDVKNVLARSRDARIKKLRVKVAVAR